VEVEGAQPPEQSDVVAALAEAGLRTAVIGSHDPLPEQAAGNSLEGRLDAVIVDCESDEDLARVAVRFAHRADVLLVGTAGLAAQLAPPAQTERAAEAVVGHRALLAIGSLAPAALGQVSTLVSAGIAHVPVPAAPSGSGRHARELLRSGHVLLTPDPAIGRADPHAVARMLGDAVSEGVDEADLLVQSGGHTAQAVLDRLGVPLLEIVAELEPGVVASRMPGRPQLVVTKAGAFGDAAALLRLLHLPTTASLQERSAS
jgi:4-hydroxythreonine-4-phosphate dehydrogenase